MYRVFEHVPPLPVLPPVRRDEPVDLLDVAPARMAYEARAAMALEVLAMDSDDPGAYPVGTTIDDAPEGPLVRLDLAPMWRALLADRAAGVPGATLARRFHRGLAEALAERCAQARDDHATDAIVALSGGCFQNRILAEDTASALQARGFRVLQHHLVPCNDGGLALGQAAIAAARLVRPPATE